MTDDIIDEELQIAKEQDQADEKVLNAKLFELPIEELDLNKALCVEEGTSVAEALSIMQNNRIGSILITKDRKLSGIVTERDIFLKVAGLPIDLHKETVESIMTPEPLSLMRTDMIAYVMNNMHVGGYRHVPIVDEHNVPVSIISIKDVMSFILDYFPEEIQNITGEPFRGPHLRESA
jgi:CBS domain-containing protein